MMPTLYSFFFSFFDKKERHKPIRNLFSTWAVGQVTNFGPWRREDNDPALGSASGRIIVLPPPRAEICHLPSSPCRNLRLCTLRNKKCHYKVTGTVGNIVNFWLITKSRSYHAHTQNYNFLSFKTDFLRIIFG